MSSPDTTDTVTLPRDCPSTHLSIERIKGWLARNPHGGTEAIHPDDLRAVLNLALRQSLASAPQVGGELRERVRRVIEPLTDSVARGFTVAERRALADKKIDAILAALSQEAEAVAFSTIRDLCGYVEDGSHTTFKLSQDDATRNWTASAGGRWEWGYSPQEAIKKLADRGGEVKG